MTRRDPEVPIEVTSRHQHVSDKTRAFVVERAQKLLRYNDRIAHIQAVLDEEHDRFLVEMIVKVDSGATMVAKEESADGYRSALDALLEKLERQIKRDKEKRVSHGHETVRDPNQADLDEPAEETYEDVVRRRLDEA